MNEVAKRHKRGIFTGGLVGGGLALMVGVAVAAILLTTAFGGSFSIKSKTVADGLTNVKATGGDDLNCTVSNISNENFTVDVTADRTVAGEGQNASGSPANTLNGSCMVNAEIENTGEVPIEYAGFTGSTPQGMSYNVKKPAQGADIAPGESLTFTVLIYVSNDAQEGSLSGSIKTQEVSE